MFRLIINCLLIEPRLKFNLLCPRVTFKCIDRFSDEQLLPFFQPKTYSMRISLRIVGLLLFVLFAVTAFAQEPTVGFRITNKKNEVVPFATVSVQSVSDSAIKKQRVTDSLGRVGFKLAPDNYIVRVQAINYEAYEKGITVKTTNAGFAIALEPQSQS